MMTTLRMITVVMMIGMLEPLSAAAETAAVCHVPPPPARVTCEVGGGSLCVETPPGGVAVGNVTLHGTVDRQGTVVESLAIAAQHEYTHQTIAVATANPLHEHCEGELPLGADFCLDAAGQFSARVSLPVPGPYAILVTASGLDGAVVERVVTTSRVQPLTLNADHVSFTPDIHTHPAVTDAQVSVAVSLIHDCTFCDFIGASTGGVTVTATDTIQPAEGQTRHIACATTVEQGGAGQFVVGVPVEPGDHQLTITACNAATPADHCPTIGPFHFTSQGGEKSFTILTPPPAPAYDASAYHTIPWSFTLGTPTHATTTANACVQVAINRLPPADVCPDTSGVYRHDIQPEVGINIVTVTRGDELYPWTFGWGTIRSPSGRSHTLVLPAAAAVTLPATTITTIAAPLLSRFLQSDELGTFLTKVTERLPAPSPKNAQHAPSPSPLPVAPLPGCEGAAGMGGDFTFGLRGVPAIGKARIEGVTFAAGHVDFTINADDVLVKINLLKDANHDGLPDGEPIPLKIGFRKVLVDLRLQASAENSGSMLLLTSPHTDCDFMSGAYCQGHPAPLIPQNFMGNAGRLGHFVACDADAAAPSVADLCHSFNSIDAQTGIISTQVLGAINHALVCNGSTAINHALTAGLADRDLHLGKLAGIVGPFELPLVLSLASSIDISPQGFTGTVDAQLGSDAISSVSVIADTSVHHLLPLPASGLIAAALSDDVINGLLSLLADQFTLDIHEPGLKKLGFDFVEKCDRSGGGSSAPPPAPSSTAVCTAAASAAPATEARSPLCNVRPRVAELLGTVLPSYHYLTAHTPLLLRVSTNPALAPRLAIGEPSPTGQIVDLQIGGLELSLYALEVDPAQPADEFGNPVVKLDAAGNPVIYSLRPDDPDPNHGAIITFELSALIALDVGRVTNDPCQPERSQIAVQLLADRSRLVLTPLAGTNATVIPPESLATTLKEKLSYALTIYSTPDKAMRIPLPKHIALARPLADDSLVALLGLATLDVGNDGLRLTFDQDGESLGVSLDGVITQLLHFAGEEKSEQFPQ